MKAKITIQQRFTVEIDGKPVNGDFKIVNDWEGMIKLECTGPCGSLIIHQPTRPANSYDVVPKMLGGNVPNGKEITFEADVVRADCGRGVRQRQRNLSGHEPRRSGIMTTEDIQKAIEVIRSYGGDHEAAHSKEDLLRELFIEHVANTAGGAMPKMLRSDKITRRDLQEIRK